MAKASAAASTETVAPAAGVQSLFSDVKLPEAPAGWDDVGTPEIDGYWEPSAGIPLIGTIVGAVKMPNKRGGMRDTVVVRLEFPTAGVVKQDKTIRRFEKGQHVGVSIRHQLQELLYYVQKKGKCYVKPIGKKDIGGGQEMWRFVCRCSGERVAPLERLEPATNGSTVSDAEAEDFLNF